MVPGSAEGPLRRRPVALGGADGAGGLEGDTLGLSRWPAAQAFSIILPRRIFAGSLIGGIAERQEMLDFCSEHGIVSDIELIGLDGVNEAYERVIASDVRYRFVIDMVTLPAP